MSVATLPKKYRKSFFYELIQNIKKTFIKKQTKSSLTILPETQNEVKEISENSMLEELKANTGLCIDMKGSQKEFMQNLKKHPELLENFSNDRLEKILQYYLDENDKKRKILKKMSN